MLTTLVASCVLAAYPTELSGSIPTFFENWEPDHVAPAMGGTCPGLMVVGSGEVFEVIITAFDRDSWKRLVGGSWQYTVFSSTVHKGEVVTLTSGTEESWSAIGYSEPTGTFTYSHVITAITVTSGYELRYDTYRAIDYNTTSVHKDTPAFGMGHTVKITAAGYTEPEDPPTGAQR